MTDLAGTPEGLQTVRALREAMTQIMADHYGKKTTMKCSTIIKWLEGNEKIIEDAIAVEEARKKEANRAMTRSMLQMFGPSILRKDEEE